jgi:beta-lactamase class A
MKKFSWILICSLFLSMQSCHSQKPVLEQLANSENDLLKPVFSNPEKYELQIIYTQINRNEAGTLEFQDFTYRLDPEAYFYPASTVKLPVAILALEKLNKINKENPSIDRNTTYQIEGDSLAYSIATDVEAIFAVSDNEANNRLFEFLGQDHINQKLKEKGLAPVRISHRLSTANSEATDTRQLSFKTSGSNENYKIKVTRNKAAEALNLKSLDKGLGYMEKDTLVNWPFNFALKNYFPLQVQHQLMKQLIFPDQFPEEKTFDLSEDDRDFLLKSMAQLPGAAGYEEEEYFDSYGKFFLFGDSKDPIPNQFKIYNKVGYAYGTLTETAYITDESRDVEFLLSATLLVNKNGIFNDNNYEYDAIGIPFLAALGREIYERELSRKQK